MKFGPPGVIPFYDYSSLCFLSFLIVLNCLIPVCDVYVCNVFVDLSYADLIVLNEVYNPFPCKKASISFLIFGL